MKKCKGCGAILQSKDPNAPGYTPKENSDYCQRCFRLIHYDDLMISMRKGIDPDVVMDRISQSDALILWVVDLFDFEAGIIPGLNRHLIGKILLWFVQSVIFFQIHCQKKKLHDLYFLD